jgi:hypothetical protein
MAVSLPALLARKSRGGQIRNAEPKLMVTFPKLQRQSLEARFNEAIAASEIPHFLPHGTCDFFSFFQASAVLCHTQQLSVYRRLFND